MRRSGEGDLDDFLLIAEALTMSDKQKVKVRELMAARRRESLVRHEGSQTLTIRSLERRGVIERFAEASKPTWRLTEYGVKVANVLAKLGKRN